MVTLTLRHLKIGYRLAFGFALMLALMVLVTTMSVVLWNAPRKAVNDAVSLANTKSTIITAMRQNVIRQGLLTRELAFPPSLDAANADMARMLDEQRHFERSQATLSTLQMSQEEQQIVAELQRYIERIRPLLATANEFVEAFNPGEASRQLSANATLPQQNSIDALNRLSELQNAEIKQRLEQFNEAADSANRALAAGSAGVLVIAALIAWLLTRSIVLPLSDAVRVATQVANGDLDHQPVANANDESGQLLLALANMILKLKEARNLLEAVARQDGLTGLANRRHFDDTLLNEWHRLTRIARETGMEGSPLSQLSLLMIDVDHFKKFNDKFGHQTGDACLRWVGKIIAAATQRKGDLAAHYGGEEFAMILPGADPEGAAAIAEKIRQEMSKHPLPDVESEECFVTVSIGVATIVPNANAKPAELIAAADAALYQAKHLGRNRVQVAAKPEASQAATIEC